MRVISGRAAIWPINRLGFELQVPKLQQQLQSFEDFKKVLRQNSMQWLQVLISM